MCAISNQLFSKIDKALKIAIYWSVILQNIFLYLKYFKNICDCMGLHLKQRILTNPIVIRVVDGRLLNLINTCFGRYILLSGNVLSRSKYKLSIKNTC